MPVIIKNGKFYPKILTCFQEKTGRFGPQVGPSIENKEYIIVTCSSSGKLSKSHIKWW